MKAIDSRYQKEINAARQSWEHQLKAAQGRTKALHELENALHGCKHEPVTIYRDNLYVVIPVKRIPDILPILEALEEILDIEFDSSNDDSWDLARHFRVGTLRVTALVTEKGTCKRMVLEKHTHTSEHVVTQLVCS